MKDKVLVGVIGCGAVARFHAESILAADNAELAGFADVRAESAAAFAKDYGARAYASVEEMLGDPSVDGVCICTPSGFHTNVALVALEAGKHILVEHPLAVTVEDCDRIIALAKEKRCVAGVISQFRFTSSVQSLRKMIQGIFHQWLYRQCRKQEFSCLQVIRNFHIRKTYFLDAHVMSDMLHFL